MAKKKTSVQLAASALGKKGGTATKAKYGKAHFQKMANARWNPDGLSKRELAEKRFLEHR